MLLSDWDGLGLFAVLPLFVAPAHERLYDGNRDEDGPCGMGPVSYTHLDVYKRQPKQYGHITRYDLLAVANPDDFSQTCAALDERSAAKDSNVTVSSTLPIMTDNVTFTFGGKSETVQLIVVPDDRTNDLDDYARLEDESKEPLSLRDGDVYLSKSSQLVLGIQPGDTAQVQDSSLNVAKVKVSDISLNYLGNTLYMTPVSYTHLVDWGCLHSSRYYVAEF